MLENTIMNEVPVWLFTLDLPRHSLTVMSFMLWCRRRKMRATVYWKGRKKAGVSSSDFYKYVLADVSSLPGSFNENGHCLFCSLPVQRWHNRAMLWIELLNLCAVKSTNNRPTKTLLLSYEPKTWIILSPELGYGNKWILGYASKGPVSLLGIGRAIETGI